MMMTGYRILMAAALFVSLVGCGAKEVDTQLERARFALDRGEWDTAIANGRAALEEDPTNVNAALLLSSAYAGRSGFGVMKLAAAIADATRERDIFGGVRDAMVSTITDVDDLSRAIDVLVDEFIPVQPSNVRYPDVEFQASLLMLIETYGVPVFFAQQVPGGPIDVSRITPAIKERVQRDMIAADGHGVNAGIDTSDPLVDTLRDTYCVLKRASGTAEGFDLDVFRDLIHCQLAPDDGADLSAANGDFLSPLVAACTDFNFDACEDSGDTEL